MNADTEARLRAPTPAGIVREGHAMLLVRADDLSAAISHIDILRRDRGDMLRMLDRVCEEGFNTNDTKSLETYDVYLLRKIGELQAAHARAERALSSVRASLDLAVNAVG